MDSLGKIFLLNSKVLDKTNHTEITRLFDKLLSILRLEGVWREYVLLFVLNAVICGKRW